MVPMCVIAPTITSFGFVRHVDRVHEAPVSGSLSMVGLAASYVDREDIPLEEKRQVCETRDRPSSTKE